MCGVVALTGSGASQAAAWRMVAALDHRGPDAQGVVVGRGDLIALGHTRLKILDLSNAAAQPMSRRGHTLVFNGEIYNYPELRRELSGQEFASDGDTEVLLAAWATWGRACLDRLVGMFAFAVWDERAKELVAVRDRFGVKPLYYHHATDGSLTLASEIPCMHAGGVGAEPDEVAWATYLTYGLLDHSPRTFWKGISSVPPGHLLRWRAGSLSIERWYDVAEASGTDYDGRPDDEVRDEYLGLLEESVELRFRSDVSVGVCLSGGLDSSLLLSLVHRIRGPEADVTAYTFATGDERFDELPWVHDLLRDTAHPLAVAYLGASEVPELAEAVYRHIREPYGGIPTLAYARLFELASEHGTTVLLDGQGMDEQWAGYDYYHLAGTGREVPTIQGTTGPTARPEVLSPELRALAEPFEAPAPFPDPLRNVQYRDIRFTKLPRALRYNDRISMRTSVELREPFLDHRLVELALRQPVQRKLGGPAGGKRFLREAIGRELIGSRAAVPKRPLQTPQPVWMQSELRDWVRSFAERGPSGPRPQPSIPPPVGVNSDAEDSIVSWQHVMLGLSNLVAAEVRDGSPTPAR